MKAWDWWICVSGMFILQTRYFRRRSLARQCDPPPNSCIPVGSVSKSLESAGFRMEQEFGVALTIHLLECAKKKKKTILSNLLGTRVPVCLHQSGNQTVIKPYSYRARALVNLQAK